ncbi:chromate transporter [Paenibacillus amylolyticus]|nr:chromate transporter [Paenibacillus amylolyticus]
MEHNSFLTPDKPKPNKVRALSEVLAVSTKLGLTSFGGPIAHLGYFHEEYVRRRKWMDERSYADLVALCQFLPGPASSQVGIGIGIIRGGLLGGLMAWLGFYTSFCHRVSIVRFPSARIGYQQYGLDSRSENCCCSYCRSGDIGYGAKLTPDRYRATIAIFTAAATLMWPTAFTPILFIVIAGMIGRIYFRKMTGINTVDLSVPVSRKLAIVCLVTFFGILILLPLLTPFDRSGMAVIF